MEINYENITDAERLEKYNQYEKQIEDANNKEDIKKIVNKLYQDLIIDDFSFNDIIYDCVIPKLKKLGVNMEYNELIQETNYERVLKENY